MGLAASGTRNSSNNYYTSSWWCCGTMFLPPIVLNALPEHMTGFTLADLHPEVEAYTRSIVAGKDARLSTTTPAGRHMDTRMSGIRREGDDLSADITLRMDEVQVFHGTIRLFGVHRRGIITFAHSVMGSLETLYDHLLQSAHLGRREVRLAIGIVEADGTIDDAARLRETLEANVSLARKWPRGGYDATLMYGVFPDHRFEYFYGSRYELRERPVAP